MTVDLVCFFLFGGELIRNKELEISGRKSRFDSWLNGSAVSLMRHSVLMILSNLVFYF